MAGKQVAVRIRSICWSNSCVDGCVKELLSVLPPPISYAVAEDGIDEFREACREICSSGANGCEHLLTKARGALSRAGFEAFLTILGIGDKNG